MKHFPGFLVLMILVAIAPLAAQTGPAAPESTEIVVPEIIIDLEDPEPEPIEPIIPDFAARSFLLGAGTVGVETLDKLQIDQSRYQELLSAQAELGTTASGQQQSVFTQGTVGLGLHGLLLGQVSIYQLGESPELRLEFDFESSDGGFSGTELVQAGEGMSRQEVGVDGSVDIPLGSAQLHVGGTFSKVELGFQGLLPDFYSASAQYLVVNPVFTLPIDDIVSLELGGEYRYGRRFYSGTGGAGAPFDQSDNSANFRAALTVEPENLMFSAAFDYQLRVGPDGTWTHRFVPQLGLFAEPTDILSLQAEIALMAEVGRAVELPFLLGFEIIPDEFFALEVKGGYRLDERSPGQLWLDYPALSQAAGPEMAFDAYWLASVDASFWPADAVQLRIGAEFRSWLRRFKVTGFSVAGSALTWDRETGVLSELLPRARLDLRPSDEFLVSLGWEGSFSDRGFGQQTIDLRAELREPASLYGGIAELELRFDGGFEVPRLSIGAWATAADIVQLELKFTDPLSLLVPGGRELYPGIGGLKEQGFRVEFLAGLSL